LKFLIIKNQQKANNKDQENSNYRPNAVKDAEDAVDMACSVWDLDSPEFIISIDAGQEDLNISYKLRDAFVYGLVKTAKTSSTWIVTNGVDRGISYIAREAVKNEFLASDEKKPVIIGIIGSNILTGILLLFCFCGESLQNWNS
jgi:hypothetical protein